MDDDYKHLVDEYLKNGGEIKKIKPMKWRGTMKSWIDKTYSGEIQKKQIPNNPKFNRGNYLKYLNRNYKHPSGLDSKNRIRMKNGRWKECEEK